MKYFQLLFLILLHDLPPVYKELADLAIFSALIFNFIMIGFFLSLGYNIFLYLNKLSFNLLLILKNGNRF